MIEADLALAVYSSDEDVRGVGYLIHRANGMTYLAIEGTESARDWVRNLRAVIPGRVGCIWAHRGYAHLAREMVRSGVLDRLDGPVTITGHSAGGAVAQLLAAYLAPRRVYPVRAVSFGAPRVFAAWVDPACEIVRHEIMTDPVPMAMAMAPVARHYLTRLYRMKGMGLRYDVGHTLPHISDHSMSLYVKTVIEVGQ